MYEPSHRPPPQPVMSWGCRCLRGTRQETLSETSALLSWNRSSRRTLWPLRASQHTQWLFGWTGGKERVTLVKFHAYLSFLKCLPARRDKGQRGGRKKEWKQKSRDGRKDILQKWSSYLVQLVRRDTNRAREWTREAKGLIGLRCQLKRTTTSGDERQQHMGKR